MLPLYLEVPLDQSALHGLPARAGDLLNSATGGPCGSAGPGAGRVLAHARQVVRRLLEDRARDWLGHCVAIFPCGPAGLAEAIPLLTGLGEQVSSTITFATPSASSLRPSARAGAARRWRHADTIPQFLALLPPDLRDRFAGRFVADTSATTPARVRVLADPIVRDWVEKSGEQLVTRIWQEPPGGLAATRSGGMPDRGPPLAVPARGVVPGFACRRCRASGIAGTGCAHADNAAFAPESDRGSGGRHHP